MPLRERNAVVAGRLNLESCGAMTLQGVSLGSAAEGEDGMAVVGAVAYRRAITAKSRPVRPSSLR